MAKAHNDEWVLKNAGPGLRACARLLVEFSQRRPQARAALLNFASYGYSAWKADLFGRPKTAWKVSRNFYTGSINSAMPFNPTGEPVSGDLDVQIMLQRHFYNAGPAVYITLGVSSHLS